MIPCIRTLIISINLLIYICRTVTLELPENMRKTMCRFRWWQPYHSGFGKDVWAIDDISLTSEMHNILEVQLGDSQTEENNIGMHNGVIDAYCNEDLTLR